MHRYALTIKKHEQPNGWCLLGVMHEHDFDYSEYTLKSFTHREWHVQLETEDDATEKLSKWFVSDTHLENQEYPGGSLLFWRPLNKGEELKDEAMGEIEKQIIKHIEKFEAANPPEECNESLA